MTKLLLIRHGESEANRERFFAGQLDAPLLDTGIFQAELTARYIAESYTVSAVYASDLQRAFKTGEIIAAMCGAPIFSDRQLREIYAGAWQGKSFEELISLFKKDYTSWLYDIGNCKTTGGEGTQELANRVLSALTKIAKEHSGETVAIATHATPIRAMECLWKGFPLDEMKNISWVSNASVTEVSFENGNWTLGKIGEDAHLAKMRTAFGKGV